MESIRQLALTVAFALTAAASAHASSDGPPPTLFLRGSCIGQDDPAACDGGAPISSHELAFVAARTAEGRLAHAASCHFAIYVPLLAPDPTCYAEDLDVDPADVPLVAGAWTGRALRAAHRDSAYFLFRTGMTLRDSSDRVSAVAFDLPAWAWQQGVAGEVHGLGDVLGAAAVRAIAVSYHVQRWLDRLTPMA